MFDSNCTFDYDTGCMQSDIWVNELLAEKNVTSDVR